MTISVLICDDSNIARKQLRKALPESWKENVTFATNGQEALDALRAGGFDVLFLDLTMPVLDGFEVLTAIKAEGLQIKTIVVSADLQAEAKRKVVADGAIDFIRKPASADTLIGVLNKHELL
jgi:CheY-like chemotaxis protein